MEHLRQESEQKKPYEPDELDRRIVEELMKNGRDSAREIAKRLKISTSTLLQRMGRMEKEGMIKGYSANLDFSKLGYDYMGLIEITIKKGALLDVQRKIAGMIGVSAVYDITGGSDSIVLAKTRSRGELSKLVKAILTIPEVERTNTHIILNVVKEDYRQLI
ncbi:Lrp/AsnC family transcriptional regulator [Candidatus Micrarchaeota archaeon]|nr:Lrp/AsnC family transcriptional regulator [Candidatus Micrarchaeota archaeon]